MLKSGFAGIKMQGRYIQTRPGVRNVAVRRAVFCLHNARPIRGALQLQRQSLRVAASAAAAAAPAPNAPTVSSKPWWRHALDWWEVGQTENEKNQKPQKLSDTLNMAWQLIASERKLIATAAFLMVSCIQLLGGFSQAAWHLWQSELYEHSQQQDWVALFT